MKSARLLVLAAVFCLSGCAAYTMVDAGKPADVGNKVFVTPPIGFAKATYPGLNGTLWTADGVMLDAFMFFTGVEPGKPLILVSGQDKIGVRTYKTDMVPDDVMELLASNLSRMDYQQVATANLRPAPFGQADGFRFDVSCTTKDGLKMKGMAIAAQRGGKLDLILFLAPGEYYYGQYSGTADQMFASINAAK